MKHMSLLRKTAAVLSAVCCMTMCIPVYSADLAAEYDMEALPLTDFVRAEQTVSGDLNADGKTNAVDAVTLQKWLLAVPDAKLESWQNADLCKDGILDVFDLCLMRRVLVGE